MIFLKQEVLDSLIFQAKAEFPDECCGFLAGEQREENFYIEENFPLENIDHSDEHFTMNPKDQFNAIKQIRSKGMRLLGNYHSHPASCARMSQEDKRLAFDPDLIYGIVSLLNPHCPVFHLFRKMGDDEFESCPFEITKQK